MKQGAQILNVHEQGGDITIWAMVDPDAEIAKRDFAVWGTGHLHSKDPEGFVGSVLIGPFVWHVFDLGEDT